MVGSSWHNFCNQQTYHSKKWYEFVLRKIFNRRIDFVSLNEFKYGVIYNQLCYQHLLNKTCLYVCYVNPIITKVYHETYDYLDTHKLRAYFTHIIGVLFNCKTLGLLIVAFFRLFLKHHVAVTWYINKPIFVLKLAFHILSKEGRKIYSGTVLTLFKETVFIWLKIHQSQWISIYYFWLNRACSN